MFDGTTKKPDVEVENYAKLLSEWYVFNTKILTWINISVESSIGMH